MIAVSPQSVKGKTSGYAALDPLRPDRHNVAKGCRAPPVIDFCQIPKSILRITLDTTREMDKIIYPVCILCRDHEKAGFIEGIKIGIRLHQELNK